MCVNTEARLTFSKSRVTELRKPFLGDATVDLKASMGKSG